MQTLRKLDRAKPLFPPSPPPPNPQSLNLSQSIALLRVVINERAVFPNRKARVTSGAGTATALGAHAEPGGFGTAGRRPGTPGLLTTEQRLCRGPGGAR